VHHVAGEDCYLLKVRTRDAQHLGTLLRQCLGRIPGVVSTRTTVVLETVKEAPRLPLGESTAAREPAPAEQEVLS
jgi:Lrp/AsnC family transcriptional regulator, leucine-responsive regulatory protein